MRGNCTCNINNKSITKTNATIALKYQTRKQAPAGNYPAALQKTALNTKLINCAINHEQPTPNHPGRQNY